MKRLTATELIFGTKRPTASQILSFKPRGKNFLTTHIQLQESDCSGDSRLIDLSPEYEDYNEENPKETTDFG